MIINSENDLPKGTRVKIIKAPEDSAWNNWLGLADVEGHIDGLHFIRLQEEKIFINKITRASYSLRFLYYGIHSLEVIDLENDPDGNY